MQEPCLGTTDPVALDMRRTPCRGDLLPWQYRLVQSALDLHHMNTQVFRLQALLVLGVVLQWYLELVLLSGRHL
jgi:hypothetical protein